MSLAVIGLGGVGILGVLAVRGAKPAAAPVNPRFPHPGPRMTATVEATDVGYRPTRRHRPRLDDAPAYLRLDAESAPRTLLAELAQSGLRGRGGGWFPTVTKLQAVRAANRSSRRPGGRPTVVGNAVEQSRSAPRTSSC